LKVKAKYTGLRLEEPQQGMGVRFTAGTLQLCTLFDQSTIATDTVGHFSAGRAVTALKDCSPSSLRGQP
jgi:hypothetical protein